MKSIADIRRENLQAIVDRNGLASTAKRFGKPDRQINDMLAGRKSFGEKVARGMEAKYAPDRPLGWLDIPPTTSLDRDADHAHDKSDTPVATHMQPATNTSTVERALIALTPSEHALLDAARPLQEADKMLLAQIAQRLTTAGPPPMESRDFLPPVPSRKKDKA